MFYMILLQYIYVYNNVPSSYRRGGTDVWMYGRTVDHTCTAVDLDVRIDACPPIHTRVCVSAQTPRRNQT